MRSGVLGNLKGPHAPIAWNDDDLVWAVTFEGAFPVPSCGPLLAADNPHPCPLFAPSMIVMVDYHDGHFVYAESPSPLHEQ